jgi:hypothetical protein
LVSKNFFREDLPVEPSISELGKEASLKIIDFAILKINLTLKFPSRKSTSGFKF